MDADGVISRKVSVFGVSRYATPPLNSTLCPSDVIPSMPVYFSAINVYGVTLFSLGGIAVVAILLLYIDILRHVMKSNTPGIKTHTAFVVSVYPVVAAVTYCAIIVPRAQLLAEAVTQGIFTAAMYQLFCLLVAYCGGEAELIRRVKPNSLNSRVGPCCCWPCCCCLPVLQIDKNKVKFLRTIVLQLPIVQGTVYVILLVMWAEEESLYQVNYVYLQPIVVLSILTGIWGMIMTMTMLKEVLKEHMIHGKFFVLQLVLLFAKIQGLITRIVVGSGVLPCRPPITPMLYGNLIYNSTMLAEILLLAIVAHRIYRTPLPDMGVSIIDKLKNAQISQICVIKDEFAGKNFPEDVSQRTDSRRF